MLILICLSISTPLVQAHQYYLPHYTVKDGLWETTISLHNGASTTQRLQVTAYDNQGQDTGAIFWTIDPHATLVGAIGTLLGDGHAETGWLHIRSDTDQLTGTIKFTFNGSGSSSLSIARQSDSGLLFPLIENHSSWRSGFALVNLSDSESNVILELVHPDGRVLQSERNTLPAHGKLVGMADDFFSGELPAESIVRASSAQDLTGFALSFKDGLSQIVAVPAHPFHHQPPQVISFAELEGVWKSRGYGFYLDASQETVTLYQHNQYGCVAAHADIDRQVIANDVDLRLLQQPGSPQVLGFQGNGSITTIYFDRVPELISPCLNPLSGRDPEVNFEFFWTTLQEHHPYLEARGLDWVEAYNEFRPQIGPNTSDGELFATLSDMMAPLRCLHTGVEGDGMEYSPGLARVFSRFEAGFNLQTEYSEQLEYTFSQVDLHQRNVKEGYLDDGYQLGANDMIFWGTIDGSIGYLNLYAFDDYDPAASGDPVIQQAILADVLDRAMDLFQTVDAVIVDVRINLGGDDGLGLMVASRFADRRRLAFSKKAKAEHGFTAYQSHFLEPNGLATFQGPVVLLTSMLTISAGEVFAVDTMPLQNITRMGEPTFGVFSDVLGRLLPNGWEASMPNELFISAAGVDHEVTGVPPHIFLPCWSHDERQMGRDSVLEAAIEFLGH